MVLGFLKGSQDGFNNLATSIPRCFRFQFVVQQIFGCFWRSGPRKYVPRKSDTLNYKKSCFQEECWRNVSKIFWIWLDIHLTSIQIDVRKIVGKMTPPKIGLGPDNLSNKATPDNHGCYRFQSLPSFVIQLRSAHVKDEFGASFDIDFGTISVGLKWLLEEFMISVWKQGYPIRGLLRRTLDLPHNPSTILQTSDWQSLL